MKYCTKCGAEMLDEAVVCVKCGCPVDSISNGTNEIIQANSRSNFATAIILNIIAFIISLVLCISTFLCLYFWMEIPETKYMEQYNTYIRDIIILAIIWLLFEISIFIIGRKSKAKNIVYLYMLFIIIKQITIYVIQPLPFAALLCGFGIILLIPSILQIIATVKFFKAINE